MNNEGNPNLTSAQSVVDGTVTTRVRGLTLTGEPDLEFPLSSMVILPGTDLWYEYRTMGRGLVMHQFMLETEVLPQEDLFPLFIFSNTQEIVFPPAPVEAMCSRLYERVLSCMAISDRPESKAMTERVLGDECIDEKAYQLSYMVVHMVSQLQVVAVDVAY